MYTVYKLAHKPSGLIYVGMTSKSPYIRFGQHFAASEKRDLKLYAVMRKSTVSDWDIVILATVRTAIEARDCEIYHINLWNLYETGLNERTGNGPKTEGRKAASARMKAYRAQNPTPWNKGRKGISEETRLLMSIAKQKNPSRRSFSEAQKKELSEKYGKEVLCLDTGIIFPSITKAALFHSLKRESVRDVVNGRRGHTAGKVFKKL